MTKRLLIGVICSGPQMERTSEVLKGIIAQAFKSNCDIVVLSPLFNTQFEYNNFRIEERYIYRLILSERFDGFIYDCRFFHNKNVRDFADKLLKKTKKPVMMVDGYEHNIFENTEADDSRPYEKLINHLIEDHGYKKIYCLTGPKDSVTACERLNGYFDAMQKHGLYYDESYYIYGDFWINSAIQLANEIINGKREMPEAIACGNDITAAKLIETLSHGGIKVPEDIAVVGFDCSVKDFNADYSITSYKRANSQLGSDVFRRLYRIITGNNTPRVKNNEEGLRIGHSCGCQSFYKLNSSEKREYSVKSRFEGNIIHLDLTMEAVNKDDIKSALRLTADRTFFLYKFSRFNICLTEDYVNFVSGEYNGDLTFDSKKNMKIMLKRHSSGYTSTEQESFYAGDILPEFAKPHKKTIAYYITPLHSLDHFFGYAALSFGKRPCSYEEAYVPFITSINNMLEHFLKKADYDKILKKNSCDSITGLPMLGQLEHQFEQLSENRTLIYVEITDIKKIYVKYTSQDIKKMIRNFADNLTSCLTENEYCAFLNHGDFVIIAEAPERAEHIFNNFKEKIILSSHSHNCNLPFTMSLYEIEDDVKNDFYEAIRRTSISTSFTYSAEKMQNSSRLFEKLCIIREKLRNNPQNEWSIDGISEEFHVSKSHLQKSYKSYFGSSIIDDLIHFRMDMAKNLLEETELSIREIAEKCGYSSYLYFTRQFKKVENITPSAYRELKNHNSQPS